MAAEGSPDGEAAELPEAVDEDGVEVGAVLPQPGEESGVEAVLGVGGAEGVNREGEVGEKGGSGIVEGDNGVGEVWGAELNQERTAAAGPPAAGLSVAMTCKMRIGECGVA